MIGTFLKGILGSLGKGLLKALGVSIGQSVSNIANMKAASVIRQQENAHLSGKEEEQNMFNAKEAALQREFSHDERLQAQEFNAEQAQKQMDFQEYMSNTQYQRQVADMQAAGVNPAMAMSGITGASASGAMATSNPASGVAASGSAQLQGLSDLLEFAQLKAEIDKTKAETEATQANTERTKEETEGTRLQNEITAEYGKLTAAGKLREMNAAIAQAYESVNLSKTQREVLIPAQAALAKAQQEAADAAKVYDLWRNEFYQKNGYWPGARFDEEFTSLIRWFSGMLAGDGPSPHGAPQVSGEELAKSLEDALKRNDIGNPYR